MLFLLMANSEKLAFENVMALTKSSERKFRKGDFKGSIEDKRKAKSILNWEVLGDKYYSMFEKELSNLYYSKFDLIFDHKLKLDETKINKIASSLEQKSNEKYEIGDYKSAIKALRRSEKYLSK